MSLDQFPDELIRQVLFYISAEDTLVNFQNASRRFHALADETLLWRYHCCTAFNYWNPSHDLEAKKQRPPLEVEWRGLYTARLKTHYHIRDLFEGILTTKIDRRNKISQIAQVGYDAKDYLLEQCHADDSVEDVLARRHYAGIILNSIHRSIAIEEWHNAAIRVVGPDARLEKALGAFDLFVLYDQEGDLDDITQMLDAVASDFQADHPTWDDWTTREKALGLVRWLRLQNLVGMGDQANYRKISHALLGQTLKRAEHGSLPIISCSIFVCIAERLGLNASCCDFPNHVHALVTARDGFTVDDIPLGEATAEQRQQRMFFDPYRHESEVQETLLRRLLTGFAWRIEAERALSPVPASAVALRVANNIKATIDLAPSPDRATMQYANATQMEFGQLSHGRSLWNLTLSRYASLWATVLLADQVQFNWGINVRDLITEIERTFQEDLWLLEKYLAPILSSPEVMQTLSAQFGPHFVNMHDNLSTMRREDSKPEFPFRRSTDGRRHPRYKIGQVFRHARYGTAGIITGWSNASARTDFASRFVSENSADTVVDQASLYRSVGDGRTYYTYITEHSPERWVVVESSIQLIEKLADLEEVDFAFAGKYFKRFDISTCQYISNVRESYPDD